MVIVLVFEEEVMRVMGAYEPQVERSDCEKDQFYNKVACDWDSQNPGKMVLGLKDYIIEKNSEERKQTVRWRVCK